LSERRRVSRKSIGKRVSISKFQTKTSLQPARECAKLCLSHVAQEENMMKTLVRFRSNKFPPYEGEEEQINPGLYGKRLAEYLVEKLKEMKIETEQIIPEDWGWYIPIRNDGFRLAICCAHQKSGDDPSAWSQDDTFVCSTDPPKPVFRKWFKKIDATEQLGRLIAAMDRILTSDSEIRDVEWEDE